jgi:8-oxo-dGTP diphosphatase
MAHKLSTHVAVFLLIRDERGRVLLQQRAGTNYLNGYYDFACSGHVDEGESLHQSAQREACEELGITVAAEDLVLIHANHNYVGAPYMNFVFELKKWDGTPSIQESEKCSDLAFFETQSLPEKCTLLVRVLEQESFNSALTFSRISPEDYSRLMGEDSSASARLA